MRRPRIAVRPPEYFPPIEYFALMQAVDLFVIADTAQYSRQSRQNRARLRTPDGSQWISIPLVGGQSGLDIQSVKVADTGNRWQTKHKRALQFNYESAPYYDHYTAHFLPLLEKGGHELVEYTIPSVLTVARLLELRTELVLASELCGKPATLPAILQEVDGELVSVSATHASDTRHGTATRVLRYHHPSYRQNFHGFVRGLSILDAFMNVGPVTAALLVASVDPLPDAELP